MAINIEMTMRRRLSVFNEEFYSMCVVFIDNCHSHIFVCMYFFKYFYCEITFAN